MRTATTSSVPGTTTARLFEAVKAVPIERTISRFTPVYCGGAALCPFHGDKHLGSFVIRSGHFKCYACGAWGDGVDFVARIRGVSKLEAALEIGENEGILSPEEAERFRRGGARKSGAAPLTITAPAPTATLPQNSRAEADHISVVYTAFVEAALPLTAEHRRHLMEERQVQGWEEDFFEWPSFQDAGFLARFKLRLREAGIGTSMPLAVRGVPGFAWDVSRGNISFVRQSGIGIVLRDVQERISGLQLRPDDPGTGGKYRLFSNSRGCNNSLEDGNHLVDSASCGCVTDILFPDGNGYRGAAITEGKFKGVQLAKRGWLTLSLNGVWNTSGPLEEFLQVVQTTDTREISVFFDADSWEKPSVAQALLELHQKLADAGFRVRFGRWDPACGKGIDDVLLAGHRDQIRCCKAERVLPALQELAQKGLPATA